MFQYIAAWMSPFETGVAVGRIAFYVVLALVLIVAAIWLLRRRQR